jgi:trans-aconitate 2-methyltransferase
MHATAASGMAPPSPMRTRRTAAALDLLRRLPDFGPRRIGNLRGGTDAAAALLLRRFPGAEIVSLAAEGAFALERGADENFDLMFSDGALETPSSLRKQTPALLAATRPDGVLALHLPNDLHEPNRQLLRMVAVDGPWAPLLAFVAKTRPFNASIEDLDALLRPLCRSVEFWQTTYVDRMDGAAAIIDSMMETSLAPFLRPLDEAMRQRFLERYAQEVSRAYPVQPDGTMLLRFPRIFLLARR